MKKIENTLLSEDLQIMKTMTNEDGHNYLITDEKGLDFEINFQNGGRNNGVNGIFHENLIEIVIDRLKFFDEKFDTDENKIAIDYLEKSLREMNLRTLSRHAKSVLGNEGEDYGK